MTSPARSIDYLPYYDLEKYLFETVSPRFAADRTLSAFDFFSIVIWKANRAKSKIARRLLAHGNYTDLDSAVGAVLAEVAAARSPKEKLRGFIEGWGFLLPMASAILTILYPDEFTVYDIRVCNEIGDYHWVVNKSRYEAIWDGYSKYVAAVKQNAPTDLSLRDKDRWLWGKSFVEQLKDDIANCFTRAESESEVDS